MNGMLDGRPLSYRRFYGRPGDCGFYWDDTGERLTDLEVQRYRVVQSRPPRRDPVVSGFVARYGGQREAPGDPVLEALWDLESDR